jgi:hypothetical protein
MACAVARQKLSAIAEHAGEWCGIPLPVEGLNLIVESRHRLYGQDDILRKVRPEDPEDTGWRLVNNWYSKSRRSEIFIFEEKDGRRTRAELPQDRHFWHDLQTMGCATIWSMDAEAAAMLKLDELIAPHLFQMYFSTGMFLETSKRSGVTYIFRRLRPTVALRPGKSESDGMRILCCLCLHPIGYYEGTWAGAMCPTDDVIAHLLLMRADEPMFWKRANQIMAHRPEAGL